MKKKIRAMWMGIALVVVAAVLTQVISYLTYTYTKHTVEWKTADRTQHNLKELERISNLKARVESAVTATSSVIEENLQNPQEIYDVCIKMVGRNKHIIGSAVALRPGTIAINGSTTSPFAAFAYQADDDGAVVTKQLPYDYVKAEWYERPMTKDSVWWSEPYRDTGGSEMLIYTFSAPIHNASRKCIGVLTGDINYKDMVYRNIDDDDNFKNLRIWILLSQIASIALIVLIVWRSTINIFRVNKLQTAQDLMNQELKIASDIQKSMLPTTSPEANAEHKLDIRVKLLGSTDISADFYDYFYRGHSLVFCLGDVPGSNVRASLMMAINCSVFRTAATIANDSAGVLSPMAIVKAMNRSFCSIKDDKMFTTLLVGVLNIDTAQLTYCIAGHPQPVILSHENGIRQLDGSPNIPVGVIDDYDYKEECVSLNADDTLFLYTNGLIETENMAHNTFGIKRMMVRLEKSLENKETPERIIERMSTDVEKFREKTERVDDAVMVAINML